MNDKEKELLLLQTIRVNGNTMYLVRQGMSMLEIKKQIDSLVKRCIVQRRKEDLSLTKEGEQYFYELNRKMGRKGFYRFLSPDYAFRNVPDSIDKVYVPPIKRTKGKEK